MIYFQSQWTDFKNLNGVWKLKRFCITCVELIFEFFVLVSFVFSLNFSLIFNFLMHEIQLKSFVFEILFIGDYSLTFYLFRDKV